MYGEGGSQYTYNFFMDFVTSMLEKMRKDKKSFIHTYIHTYIHALPIAKQTQKYENATQNGCGIKSDSNNEAHRLRLSCQIHKPIAYMMHAFPYF